MEKLNISKESKLDHVDLTITFVDIDSKDENGNEKQLEGVPPIRVIYLKKWLKKFINDCYKIFLHDIEIEIFKHKYKQENWLF